MPEVKTVGRRTGRAELDEHAEGVHSSEIDVDLEAVRTRRKPRSSPISARRLAVLPLSINVGQPISHRLDHMLSGVRAEIALKIFGDDLDTLRSTAERSARPARRRFPASTDLQVEKQVRIPQLEIRVDYGRAALYGVQPGAVVEQLSRLSNGRVVCRVVDGYRRFDVVMRLPDRIAHDAAARRSADRDAVGLDTGAPDRRHHARPTGRTRSCARTAGAASSCSPTRDGTTDMAQIVERDPRASCAATQLPEGYFASLEGTFQAQEQASRTIGMLSLVSLSLIFAILYSRYRSAVLALIIMGSVPLALIGSVAALWLAGQPLSVASMIGFITLTGIAARNGILKISHYINLALHEGDAVRPRAGRARQPRTPDAGADDGARRPASR